MLWPARTEKLTIDFNRQLRADKAIRIETKTNTTKRRSRRIGPATVGRVPDPTHTGWGHD